MNDDFEYENSLNTPETAAPAEDEMPEAENAVPAEEAAPIAEAPAAPQAQSAPEAEGQAEGPVFNAAETPAFGGRESGRFQSSGAAWSDAGYIPAQDASTMPRNYNHYYTAPPKREKAKKSHRGAKTAGIIAACLACAILGGTAAGFAVPKLTERFSAAQEETASVTRGSDGTVISVAAPTATPQVTTSVVTGGSELSATEIYYDLAVKQTVAITTEITYTNVWGNTTSGAVKGSGFILSPDGYIMTNYHVIEDAVAGGYDIEVLLYDGTKYIANVVGYAEDDDVAVLKIDAEGLNAVTIGDSDSLLVGQSVYAVGNPLCELEFSMASGMVSATDREITTSENGRTKTITMFQIDAPINSGNSGGPVYNSRGEVVGIATAKYSSTGVEGLGFAIPINDAVTLAHDLITDGYVRGRAYLGIGVDTVTAAAAQYYGLVEGAIVTSVTEDSAAAKAGLRESDIIVSLGDTEIKSREDLISAKKDFHAGDTTELRVYRGGEYVTLHITFDEEVPEENSAENDREQGAQNPSGDNQVPGDFDDFYDFFGGYPFGGFNPFG